jgi:hypothetical protein
LIDEEDLAKAIHGMLSEEAREKMGPMKIRRKRQRLSKKMEPDVPSDDQQEILLPQTVANRLEIAPLVHRLFRSRAESLSFLTLL